MANKKVDVLVIGAGAAGLMCGAVAAARGRQVEVIDHAKKVGRKILMSGGGRCNFTNMYAGPENFLSNNPHFCKSALSRYTQWDFIALVDKYQIPYHEKTLGQLFCDDSAKDIVNLLVSECEQAGATITLRTEVISIEQTEQDGARYLVKTDNHDYECESLVIATGGLSMPKIGASPFGYKVAQQFGLEVLPTRAALVPLTLHDKDKEQLAALSGIAVDITAEANDTSFKEAMLFTHRGISGPAILQISSYWQPGDDLTINLSPEQDVLALLTQVREKHPEQELKTCLAKRFPKRFVETFLAYQQIPNAPLKVLNEKQLSTIAEQLHQWQLKPNGTEGYRTAEVTIGGVNTDQLSSKTMEAKQAKGLYFIGEVVDVTGWLGGFNFQWAWSSGWAAGQVV
ncbi:BaiN/RdsA family NAD(P)/FAD-dependent oxidoreductase [Flocculibacter collagenilyticus]|uniref:NAD(P)/FAD-dependent oxidoreductase n=1 Tax=Flocculibacter collagenilyticus TaxID=2744479 RepID=UPI0018F7509E|nr:NAD(P)/FAD-dependent oxidoreductase [Flocculibacter collagenilyticus]